jgi:hypothetical protein
MRSLPLSRSSPGAGGRLAHAPAGKEVAALVMRAREAVADELFGDEGQRIAVAQLRLIRRIARPHADIVEHGPGGAWPPPGYGFWQVERCPT